MKKLLPIIILAACAVLGAGGGFGAKMLFAKSTPEATDQEADAHAHTAAAEDTHGKKGKDHGKKKSDGHGGKDDQEAAAFMKFSRQFVVPASAASRSALVILDLNIEVTPEASQRAYALEPKLRASCLAALLRLSAEGRLAAVMTSAEEAAAVRAALLEAARTVLGEGAIDVLITDVAVQNM